MKRPALTYRPSRRLTVLGGCALVGMLAALAGAAGSGKSYGATVAVRAQNLDPSCLYYTCPAPVATATGFTLVSAQSNLIEDVGLARLVHNAVPGSPSVAELKGNVRAKSDGNSETLFVTYQGDTPQQAQRLAFAYAQQYALAASRTASGVAGKLRDGIASQYDTLSASDEKHTVRGRDLATTLGTMTSSSDVYATRPGPPGLPNKPGAGPGSPIVYAASATQLPVVATSPGFVRLALMGAAAGLVVGIVVLLFSRPRDERPARAGLLVS